MIVVTGANGFIGSNLVLELTRRLGGGGVDGVGVLSVDDYPSIRGGGVATRPPLEARYAVGGGIDVDGGGESVETVAASGYLDYEDLPGWLATRGRSGDADGVEAVYHLGACSDTTVSERDYVMRVNFEYTRRLWSWAAGEPGGAGDSGEPVTLVYASSAATYGDGTRGYDDRVDPSVYTPLNLYGESKQRFDLWALDQMRRGRPTPARWAGVKYFNVYGPREDHKQRMASVAFHAFHQVCDAGRVKLFESHKAGVEHGGQRRDFVYVGDAVAATLALGGHGRGQPGGVALPDATEPGGNLFNVGTGEAATFRAFAEAVFAAMGLDPDIAYIPMPEDLRGRYQYFTQAEMSKLRGVGYTAAFADVAEGVGRYVRDYLLHRYPRGAAIGTTEGRP